MGDGQSELSRGEIDRVIMMAWEDRTSFDGIQDEFGVFGPALTGVSH